MCGACVGTPADTLKRSTDTKEYNGSGPPDLGCLTNPASVKPLGVPKTVTLRGYVKIFANGPDSKNVKIEVFKEKLDGSKPTGQLGDAVGAAAFSVDKLADGTGTKQETVVKSGTAQTRTLYPYELAGVPTETPLIIKTSSKTSVDADGWFPLYDFNVVVRNDDATCATADLGACFSSDGVYRYFARALGNDDYASILRAAYARAPEGGKSAIAGEVHDCADVRLSNATVGIGPNPGLGLFYLSEEEDNPLPEASRHQTGRLGLYAAGGLQPGTYTVGAAGKGPDGALTALGSYPVQTFPDSVSVFTFRGLRPWQVK